MKTKKNNYISVEEIMNKKQVKPDGVLIQTLECVTEQIIDQYKKVKGSNEKKAYLVYVNDFVQYMNQTRS